MKNPFKICLCCWCDPEKNQPMPNNNNVHINTCTFDNTILSHTVVDTSSTTITYDSSYGSSYGSSSRFNLSTTLMNKRINE